MELIDKANEICNFLLSFPEVKSSIIYGSIANGDCDEYSDIDIKIDVSGIDNGEYAIKLPRLFKQKYNVIFADYAPSLAPQQYIVSMAISTDNPFMMVDINCTASPHIQTVQKGDLTALNGSIEHTLKLFVANLKHYIRKSDCFDDIKKMYSRTFGAKNNTPNEYTMLNEVFEWLNENASEEYTEFLVSLKKSSIRR